MEVIKKYPKAIQWIFLLIVFFALCFAIQIPDGYEFAKAGTEFIDKEKLDQTKYSVFWRLPAFIAWMPGWINDSVYFLKDGKVTTGGNLEGRETEDADYYFRIRKGKLVPGGKIITGFTNL